MGNCILTIEVIGAHHNGLASDIDQLAHQFVLALNKAGHSVMHASMKSSVSANLVATAPMKPRPEETE